MRKIRWMMLFILLMLSINVVFNTVVYAEKQENTIVLSEEIKESKTSKLGHIKNSNILIHEKIGGNSFKAGSELTNLVYYIKKEAKVSQDTYYLLSTMPSSENGIVGWANEKDLSVKDHVGIDKIAKTFYIKGNGKATSKAWGGNKDTVFANMLDYINDPFNVDLTEKVGDDIWYRGNFKGKRIWLHSSYVYEASKQKTSLLGHIINREVKIYDSIGGNFKPAGAEFTNAVYYIKEQAVSNGQLYYLISTSPSNTNGVVGWVKSEDLSVRTHTGVDKNAKTLYIKGNGKATTKAWGGSKDTVYSDMSKFINEEFKVDLTEKVGNNTWYRGNFRGQRIWLHSSYVYKAEKKETSLLGHIINGQVKIYRAIGGESTTAGSEYTNAVYYIKEQATSSNQLYYLLSTTPDSKTSAVGWVKANDLSIRTHRFSNNQQKLMVINGKGKATTKPWGGKKDDVYSKLTDQKGELFLVKLTEKVGVNTWYYGVLNNKNVWIHANHVDEPNYSSTSLLGHIISRNVMIYDKDNNFSYSAGSEYTNAVYYIKKQARAGEELYYLISKSPSAVNGVVGWVNAQDLSTRSHVGVDKKTKIFYINGLGKATSKAWGGSKDTVYSDMQPFKNNVFIVNLTEKVGNNIWYRGHLNGKQIWLHSNHVAEHIERITEYGLPFNEALKIQMERLKLVNSKATESEVAYYLKAENFINDPVQKFQFLELSSPSGASVEMLNNYLNQKIYDGGTLKGKGQVFYNAARKYNMNEAYLIAHARLESGNGKSPLSSGKIQVGEYGIDKWVTIETKTPSTEEIHIVECVRNTANNCVWKVTKTNANSINLSDVKNKKIVYNMFGIGAVDDYAHTRGSVTAYQYGWFSPELAIDGGAKWIRGDYINNRYNQNTLYKMRWNPKMAEGAAWKQYASDIGWAYKQAVIIYGLYEEIGITNNLIFDYPVYR